MLIAQPTREAIQSLLSSQFDSLWSILPLWCFKGFQFGTVWVFTRWLKQRGHRFLLADSEYSSTPVLSRRRTVVFGELNVPILAIEDLIVLEQLCRSSSRSS